MSMINFMLWWVEHDKSFLTCEPDRNGQNVGPEMDPNCLICLKEQTLLKNQLTKKIMNEYAARVLSNIVAMVFVLFDHVDVVTMALDLVTILFSIIMVLNFVTMMLNIVTMVLALLSWCSAVIFGMVFVHYSYHAVKYCYHDVQHCNYGVQYSHHACNHCNHSV